MKSLTLNLPLALLASLTLVNVSASVAAASEPKALLVNPGYPGYPTSPSFYLPKFGFNSYNIGGYGDRVTSVQWGGLAAQLGLESGDTILSLNGFPLSYHGAWNDALYQAMQNGGFVQLSVRDVRTGWIVNRSTYVGGGIGPVTPKYHVTGYGPTTSHMIVGNGGFHNGQPVGPITTKKMVNPPKNNNLGNTVQQVVKLIQD